MNGMTVTYPSLAIEDRQVSLIDVRNAIVDIAFEFAAEGDRAMFGLVYDIAYDVLNRFNATEEQHD